MTDEEYEAESTRIIKEADEILKRPIVVEHYALTNQPSFVAIWNSSSLAVSCLEKAMHKKMQRIRIPEEIWMYANARKIVAECIHRKAECQKRRQPYDHFKDAESLVDSWYRRYVQSVTKK